MLKASEQAELNAIVYELQSIISEIKRISAGMRQSFCGVGSYECANSLDCVFYKYEGVLHILRNLDKNAVVEGFSASQNDGI